MGARAGGAGLGPKILPVYGEDLDQRECVGINESGRDARMASTTDTAANGAS